MPAGWTALSTANGVLAFVQPPALGQDPSNFNKAIVLSESLPYSSISTTISGLTAGTTYVLTFDYFGDNHTGTYSFDVMLDGNTTPFSAQGVAALTHVPGEFARAGVGCPGQH